MPRKVRKVMPRESSPNPHTASIAVWDIPAPVVRGRLFKVHMGGKVCVDVSAHGCAGSGP